MTTIAAARNLSSQAVIQANTLQILRAPYSSAIYGPVSDGDFVPALPGLLLAQGDFAQNVSVMVGHNTRESPSFSPPYVQTNQDLIDFLRSTNPGAPAPVLDYIVNELYPADYNGSQPYSSPLERTFLLIQEGSFTCNTNFLNRAFKNQTYAYEFQVPPALHGQDVAYTFYHGQGTNLSIGLFAPVAQIFQAYLVNFAQTGNPNGRGLPNFPMQGNNATLLGINATYIRTQRDDTANPRCAWWQKSLLT